MSNKLPRLIATVGFLGYSPIAPGTVGSLAAGLAFLLFPHYLSSFWFVLLFLIVFALSIWASDRMAGPQNADPQEVVIDEVVGMFVTLLFLPLDLLTVGIGFVLFRVFDIIKPFPARRAESLPGGWGIVMDDVVAGVYANLILRLILSFDFSSFTT